jgi:hypothetical protein
MNAYLEPDDLCAEYGHAPEQYECGCKRCQVCDSELHYCKKAECVVFPLDPGHKNQPDEIPF